MVDIHKNNFWQSIAQKSAQAAHNPVLREKHFRELAKVLTMDITILSEKIKFRSSPKEFLLAIRNSSGLTPLHGQANFFFAGMEVPSFMKQEGNHFYILDEDQQNPMLIEGAKKAQELIAHTMEQVGTNAINFSRMCKLQNKIPFDLIKQKFIALKPKLDMDMVEAPRGASLQLRVPFPNNFTFEDALELIIYVHPMITGEINAWLKTATCEYCGNVFFYERNTSKFCSDTCRMAAAYKSRRSK